MPKNRLFLISLLVLLLALLALLFAPLILANGVRFWVWWAARQEGFVADIDTVDAPFLRPVLIRRIHLKSKSDDARRVEVTATDVTVGLNFKHLLLHMDGRLIRDFSTGELHVQVHRADPSLRIVSRRAWATLERLLPQNLNITNLEVRLENGPALILLRGGSLSASETEAGRFAAAEVLVASPLLHQTFSQLRGATHWEANRLTLGGLTLSRGLDVQSATADLSRLGNERVGLTFDIDAFGGKIRGNISYEWRSPHSNWKIAGATSDISLAQTSDAFGFTDHVQGLLHAGNFTFRGNLVDPDHVTASLWSELTGLTWRNRTAEAIMLGAALYNRKIQLQQLYIRQKSNEFTLSGEAAFPTNSSGWLSPDFRGTISASISQLGDFVALFGANPQDFAGKVTMEGAMDTRDRKFGGHLALEGASLTLFKTAIDSFTADVNLKSGELKIEQLEIKRKNDSLNAEGSIDLSHDHDYSGTLDVRVANLLDYFPGFRGSTRKNAGTLPMDVRATINESRWDARGAIHVADSSPVAFTTNFPLRIGTDWAVFQLAPLNVTVDFASVFLAKAPQVFHPAIFRDGILSGSISLTETLQHPHITGDLQLVNGKLSGESLRLNITEASSRVAFEGNRATVEFFNIATNEVDLSLQGEIDFEDTNSVTIRMIGATPMFDLTQRQLDCVDEIKIAPTLLTLAPAVAEFEFCGSLFESNWTVSFKESIGIESLAVSGPDGGARKVPLCPGAGAEKKTLLLGALPRPDAPRETAQPKKQEKRR
jgi:hypothetical protein